MGDKEICGACGAPTTAARNAYQGLKYLEGRFSVHKDESEAQEIVRHAAQVIQHLEAEVERLRKSRDSWKELMEELCDEWHEDDDAECDSYGHTETCRAVSLINAKRDLNRRAEKAEALLDEIRKLPDKWDGCGWPYAAAQLRALFAKHEEDKNDDEI